MSQETASQRKIKIAGSSEDKQYNFSDEKSFELKASNAFTLIETDKPVYKPGQKGKKNLFFSTLSIKDQ